MTATILQGNCIDVLKTLPDCSVQCVVTSPPYYGLRDYGTAKWEGGDPNCDHSIPNDAPNSKKMTEGQKSSHAGRFTGDCRKCGARRIDSQIGLEETPEAYVEKLVAVFREVRRVLKDDGTLWLNLGDSYWGGKGQSGTRGEDNQEVRHENGASINRGYQTLGGAGLTRPTDGKHPVVKPKDLIGIPWMVAFALRSDGWYLRQDIIWNKPNPMPESVTDRCTKSHEYIFLLTKSKKYFYDHVAILEPAKFDGRKDTQFKENKKYVDERDAPRQSGERWPNKIVGRTERKMEGTLYGVDGKGSHGHSGYYDGNGNPRFNQFEDGQPARNKRSVWTVTTKPYKEAHFATFPPDLIEPCILAGTSAAGECPQCGKAWIRETKKATSFEGGSGKAGRTAEDANANGKWAGAQYGKNIKLGPVTATTTTGWTPQCECGDDPVPQTVLDVFNGSGTAGEVSLRHGLSYVGIELNPAYIELTNKRLAKVQVRLV